MTSRADMDAAPPNHLFDLEPMTDEEYEGNKHNCEQLRVANARLIAELQQMGAEPDFAVSMFTTFFDGLVAVGVLTKAQHLVIQLGWETTFHHQLEKMHQQATEFVQTMQARQRLAVPGGRPEQKSLLIPGR